jgi:hypothetical protein
MNQCILHVLFDSGNQAYIINKKLFKQVLRNIAFIAKELSEYFFVESLVFERFPVIDICLSDHKFDDFPPVIDDRVQFKSKEPSDRRFSIDSHAFEYLMGLLTFDVAYPDGGGINEGYACAFAQTA